MPDNRDFLIHYGVKGQKKGVRRYQNEDMSLTPEGREHYGIGQGRQLTGYRKTLDQTKQVVNRAATIVKNKTQSKISEVRGPKHMSDEELNARIKRLRSESEYLKLQREVNNGGSSDNGGKGGGNNKGFVSFERKHPYLHKALLIPVAGAIAAGTAVLAKEKVDRFLEGRADVKLKTFLRSAKTSTNVGSLSKLLESARRAAETAGHPMQGIPNPKKIVETNLRSIASTKHMKETAGLIRDVIKKRGRTKISTLSIF